MTSTSQQPAWNRRGNVLLISMFAMVSVLFFALLSINVLSFCVSEEVLQHAADTAALSAVHALQRSNQELTPLQAARLSVQSTKLFNHAQGLESADVKLGRVTRNGSGPFQFWPDETPYNAAQVTCRRNRTSSAGTIPVLGGSLLGRKDVEMECRAVAAHLENDLAIVVDTSGFTHGPNRFSGSTFAFDTILDVLESTTQRPQLGLVTFSREGDLVQDLTMDYSQVRQTFQTIRLRGPRNIEGGITEALRGLFQSPAARSDSEKTILLLSETKNTGQSSTADAVEMCQELGVTIHVLSFSRQADHEEADFLAQQTGGQHLHDASEKEIQQLVQEILDRNRVFLCE